jgi:beta-N-acetylhexosaminidase
MATGVATGVTTGVTTGVAAGVTRRGFLKGTVLIGGALALPGLAAACSSGGTADSSTAGSTPAREDPPLERKAAQMIMVGFRGLTLEESNYIYRDIEQYGIGGTILFDYDAKLESKGRNITSPEQLQALTAALDALSETPLFIAVDQEGGKVSRLKESYGFPPTASAQYLGTLNDPVETKRYADSMAATLAANGFNMNFAPVLDLNVNPTSPAIGAVERSFSADPAVVTEHAGIFVASHDAQGVATCFKHFPGHGSATADSHLGFVDVTDTWSEVELEPYRNLIDAGQARMVMTAHVFNRNIDADLPATLSPAFITGILREELGFDGVVVTDDLQMEGLTQFFDYPTIVERSILAGADIILVSNNLDYDPEITPATINHVVNLVRSGRITEERIDESYRRIMALKAELELAVR